MKQVIVLNDIAGIAACTLGVSLPILSVCDCKVYPMPTAVFSSSTRVAGVQCVPLSDFLPKVAAHWSALPLDIDAILMGCFADEVGVEAAIAIVEGVRKEGTLVLVDPVMGDEGRVFASEAHSEAMRRLVAKADITCPNFTEFCVLCGADFAAMETLSYQEKLAFLDEKVPTLGVPRVVVTGIRGGDTVCNYVYDNGMVTLHTHPFHHFGVCGTGDMFSNIMLTRVLYGQDLDTAVQTAGEWIASVTETMPAHPEYGLYLGGERLIALRKGILD